MELRRPREEVSLLPLPLSSTSCQAAEFQWDLGLPHLTYRFLIHDSATRFEPGYDLLLVDPHASIVHVRSPCFSGTSHTTSAPCSSYKGIGCFVNVVKDHAAKSFGNLDRASLSHNQLLRRLEEVEKRAQTERLKVRHYFIFQMHI